MLRTLAFIGVAAVAYKQLKKSGSIERFREDLGRRTDELRARAASRTDADLGPAATTRSATAPTAAI